MSPPLFKTDDANRIVDKIVKQLKEEADGGTGMLAIFVGVMLAMLSILRSGPESKPPAMVVVQAAVELCLAELDAIEATEPKPKPNPNAKPN